LPEDLLKPGKYENIDFVDSESPELRARRNRVRAKLGLKRAQIARYQWKVISDGKVENDDIDEHLKWLLGNFEDGIKLTERLGPEFQCWISVFWLGNGTGGGPLLTIRSMEILLHHRIEIGVAFYLDD
jgi:hypothetical protein